MNTAVLVGRLTRDPELRYTPNGVATCSFTLAVDDPFKKDETDFIPVVVWRQQAEAAANYLRKGRLAGVSGRIKTRNYEKDGRKVYVTELLAENVRFLEPPVGTQKQEKQDDDVVPIEINPDDLPF